MQIHELFQRPTKINEDLSSFFGLNNPAVKQAWDQIGGELIQDLSARFTKDPRYANMSLEQRKKAIAQDQSVQQMAQQKYEEWQKYITSLETKARGTPLTDQQYQAAFLNWANQSLFNNKFNSLDSAIKVKAQEYFTRFVSHRGDPDAKRRSMYQTNILGSLIADETARAVQVATDLQKTQAALAAQQKAAAVKAQQTNTNAPMSNVPAIGMPAGVPQPTTKVQPTATPGGSVKAAQPGAPTPAELQKFDQLVAKAAKA
jgi:hypothetical protein